VRIAQGLEARVRGHSSPAGHDAAPLLARDLQAAAHGLDCLPDGLEVGNRSRREAMIMSQEDRALGWKGRTFMGLWRISNNDALATSIPCSALLAFNISIIPIKYPKYF
jgi:hypothetical protein